MMDGRLAGRIVLITGACGDIGRATAAACAREQATVVGLDVQPAAQGQEVLGASAQQYVRCDVSDAAAVRDIVEALDAQYGHLDVVIANAGVTGSVPALDVSHDEWRRVLDINLSGAFQTAQAAAATMVRRQRPGVLLFTGSWVGDVPSKGLLPYCVSKAGVQMVARCLALELAPHGIRANVVAPGVLDAGVSAQIFREFPERRRPFEQMVPLGTLGTAEQVAESLVFLSSDAANYITGTTLLVDGGASLFQFHT